MFGAPPTELLDALDYDPALKGLVWRKHPRDVTRDGLRADSPTTCGSRTVWFCGKSYGAARLVWKLVHGTWPARKIFYVNGDSSDISPDNLKEGKPFDHARGRKQKSVKSKNPRARQSGYFKYRFGITLEDYERMHSEQGGVCAICEKPETVVYRGVVRNLCVDHDHVTGQVRGLLCHACNIAIGNFRDDPFLLEAGAAYLRQHARPANVLPLKKEFGR